MPSASPARPISLAGVFHLMVIYLVWGSTYLAIRVAVRPGAGFPPFTLAALRITTAGVLLLLWAGLTRQRLRPTRQELSVLGVSALLLWLGGNGLVSWAEQRADSSLAALIIGATPIWVALIEAALDRRAPSALLVVSLLVGFSGIALLSVPAMLSGIQVDPASTLALLLAGVSWGAGTLLQSRRPVGLGGPASAAIQQLIGGSALALAALAISEPAPAPTPQAWLAWSYLVLFGSVLAFSSYVQALKLLPTSLVTTYAFVNPAIAVFLGWLILDEQITSWTAAGAALILLGVAGVFRARQAARPV
jgi:drug/metabolite transporter (DMT)-like permease